MNIIYYPMKLFNLIFTTILQSWQAENTYSYTICYKPFITGTLSNIEDPDEMLHMATFNQHLLCLLRLKQYLRMIHHNLATLICDPLKHNMVYPIITRGEQKFRGKELLNHIAFIDCNENS